MILHIMNTVAWKNAVVAGEYAPASLAKDGFIHCSTPEQLLGVANTFYRDQKGLFVLYIDESKVISEVVYEDLYETGKLYPHIYGPLNLDAVVRIVEYNPDEEGSAGTEHISH
ncbi:DUF952 domain-containing protein [Paenibacillus lemnae]|uniref:DUF952 domain-containing protein n=1 Tax=Paenibacillus lemnae TaxID=1330551 RepID=A0A848MDH3_PAELE|nr:DUF952 domain-containing protein [Paenibacillus lemnae]NMO98200.1 DUF952 domain-containing protein [Paenibacillus lemnae]